MFIMIEPTDTLTMVPGNFGSLSAERILQMPKKLHRLLRPLNLRTAEQLLSYAESFPTAIALTLNWSIEQAREAAKNLDEQIRPLIGPRPAFRECVGGVRPPSTRRYTAPVVQPALKKSRWSWLFWWLS